MQSTHFKSEKEEPHLTTFLHKHSVVLHPLFLGTLLCLSVVVIVCFSPFWYMQNLQDQLENQAKVIETLKVQVNLICAEKLLANNTLENSLVSHRSKRSAQGGEVEVITAGRKKSRTKKGGKRIRRTSRRRDKKSDRRGRNRNRQRDESIDEVSRRSAIQAIHLNIDSERSEPGSPLLLTGPEGSVVNYWKKSDASFNENDSFQYNHNGTVTVKKNGLYFMYSQMTYFDRTGRWSHVMDIAGKPYIKCLLSEWGVDTDPATGKYYSTAQQCYTSAVTFIRKGDQVCIRSMYPDRNIHGDENLSFWGLIHLS